jgi:hypothetical protein
MSPTQEERADSFARSPRPLDFIRVRLYRGGQAEYIRDLLEDEKEALFEELGTKRSKGIDENSPEVEEIRTNLRHVINALRDLTTGMIELRGLEGF